MDKHYSLNRKNLFCQSIVCIFVPILFFLHHGFVSGEENSDDECIRS